MRDIHTPNPDDAGSWPEFQRKARKLMHSAVLVALLIAASAVPAAAENAAITKEVADPQETLAAQQALIENLQQRLEELEASHAQILAKLEALVQVVPNKEEIREERAEALSEVRNDLDQVEDSLDIHPSLGGYYDFEYLDDDQPDSPGAFRQHHVTMLLSKDHDDFRFFSEIEFEFGTRFKGSGGTHLTEARGEVKLEQAWAEYLFADELVLRGGLILTPGYWNVRHWPNLILSTRRPLMVRNVYPESFVGLMAHGTTFLKDSRVTYQAYVGNGESADFAREDDNENKAVGGRASFQLPTRGVFDTFELGISSYTDSPPGVKRNETWGLDTQIRKGPVELLAEYATRSSKEDRTGFYLQPSYRLNELVTAFYRYDYLDIEAKGKTREHTLGFNFQPLLEVMLKIEYFRVNPFDRADHNGLASSIAIAF